MWNEITYVLNVNIADIAQYWLIFFRKNGKNSDSWTFSTILFHEKYRFLIKTYRTKPNNINLIMANFNFYRPGSMPSSKLKSITKQIFMTHRYRAVYFITYVILGSICLLATSIANIYQLPEYGALLLTQSSLILIIFKLSCKKKYYDYCVQ